MSVGGEEGDATCWEAGVVGCFAGCGGGFLGGAGGGFAGYCAGSGAGLRTGLGAGCCGFFVVVVPALTINVDQSRSFPHHLLLMTQGIHTLIIIILPHHQRIQLR